MKYNLKDPKKFIVYLFAKKNSKKNVKEKKNTDFITESFFC